jgi:glycosyltransferase involved in cell wall biosynthesis
MVSQNNKKRILFLGQQSHVESIMNICDIGILITDKNHNEGISNAILEYYALSKPVIATYGGGTQEIIKQNFSGFLIEHESPYILIDRINYLLLNKKERLDFGMKANEIVKDKFEISKMIEAFKMLYLDVTTKH